MKVKNTPCKKLKAKKIESLKNSNAFYFTCVSQKQNRKKGIDTKIIYANDN